MLTRAEFVEKFKDVYEHSAWVAEAAYPLLAQNNSRLTAADVHAAMADAFRAADAEKRLAVLNAHPDLAGKLAQAKRLTDASTLEQASAGLDALTDEERETFSGLNARYVARFGFPFIIAVRDHSKQSILAAFRARLENNAEREFAEACRQVERIAFHRLKELM